AADNAQKCHVQHSRRPRLVQTGKRSNMGQISMEKSGLAGSVLDGNQQPTVKTFGVQNQTLTLKPL
ncbi:MAG TPA: hypothetical protein VHO91_05250, partial [Rhodopila sp.]|nr:hypothetical protein [Rhodopila sp.]